MAIIVKPYTFSAGAIIVASEHNSNFDTMYNDYNGNITSGNILSVSGASFINLALIPGAAGQIPTASLPLTLQPLAPPSTGFTIAGGVTSSTLTVKSDTILNGNSSSIEFVIDGGGAAITTGTKGYLEIPFACAITSVTALADTSGTINIDIKKSTYAGFPSTASISSGGTGISITTGTSIQNNALTGWALGTSAGSILEFYASGCTSITRVTASLKVNKI